MLENTQVATAPVKRMAIEPYPVNPFRWHAILETDAIYQTAEINTRTGSIDSDPERDVLYKPADTPAVEAAKRTFLGQVYLDWGTWAVVRDVGQEPVPGIGSPATAAQPHLDHRRVLPTCALPTPSGELAAPPGPTASQRLGLHRRRPRRRRRGHGRPRTKIGASHHDGFA